MEYERKQLDAIEGVFGYIGPLLDDGERRKAWRNCKRAETLAIQGMNNALQNGRGEEACRWYERKTALYYAGIRLRAEERYTASECRETLNDIAGMLWGEG